MTTIFIPVVSSTDITICRKDVEPTTLTELVGMIKNKGIDVTSLKIVVDCPFDCKALNRWSEVTVVDLFDGDNKAYKKAKRDLGKCLGMRGDKADKFIKTHWAYQTEKTPTEVSDMLFGWMLTRCYSIK